MSVPDTGNTTKDDWRADMLSKPSISVRKGIAHNHEEPYEDTSTLVLTVPSGKFVDIRFPTPWQPDIPAEHYPQFWAFSGTSRTTFYEVRNAIRPGFAFTSHTVFTHDIDSKGPGIVDEGDDFLLPNGDVMEVGIMPGTGKLYKEFWTQHDPAPGRDELLKRPVVVIESKDNETGRGIILRVGDFIQGVYKYHEHDKLLYFRFQSVPATETHGRDEYYEKGAHEDYYLSVGDRKWVRDTRSSDVSAGIVPWDRIATGEQHLDMQIDTPYGEWEVTEYIGEIASNES